MALGAALGVFFGFLIPVAQIFASAVFALAVRANLPVAVVSTLVSNPFTYAPIFVLAHRTGAALLGEGSDETREAAVVREAQKPRADPQTWGERVGAVGKPLALGLAVFAVAGGAIAWTLVNVAWWGFRALRRRRRRAQQARSPG